MKIDNILLDKLTAQAKESLRLRSIMKDLLSDIRREDFPDVARKLMNHYCVLKKDSRYDGDLIFRFAEIVVLARSSYVRCRCVSR